MQKCPLCKKSSYSKKDSNNKFKCPSCFTHFSEKKDIGLDNVHWRSGCPSINDGRFLTNYAPPGDLDIQRMAAYNIRSVHNYRAFLQNHAKDFLDRERNDLVANYSTRPKISCSQGWEQVWRM